MQEADQEVIYDARDLESVAYEAGDGDYTVAVIGHNHGDESGPVEVFEEMFDELPETYDDLSLSFVPDANVFASVCMSRKTPLEFQSNQADQRDMNRSYETARKVLESEDGTSSSLNLTRQAAYHVLNYLDDLEPDLVIDMHTGTSGTVKMPQIRYKHRDEYAASEDAMRDIAENAGVDMFATDPGEDAQMLGAIAPKMGFPALTIEVGGGIAHGGHAFEDTHAEKYEEILRNIFNYALEEVETDFTGREFSSLKKRSTDMKVGGEVEYLFDLGEEVEEGDVVATVGEEHEITAEHSGIVETILTDKDQEEFEGGNRIFNIAKRN